MEKYDDSSIEKLHIGDYVVLRLSKPDEGWLSSEGLLDDECFMTNDLDHFDNSIWEIHVQNQYSASRELKDAKSKRQSIDDSSDIDIRNIAELERSVLNEKRLNNKLMSIKRGKPIAFGDPIQLRHVKSRKYLTISSNMLAKKERENMMVTVDTEGDALSSIAFMPRYRYDREGQPIGNNAEILIRVHERPGEYLHASKSELYNLHRFEVNCSLDSTFWTLSLYQKGDDAERFSVLAGQLVTLQDPDSLACITVDRTNSPPNDIINPNQPKKIKMSSQFQLRDLGLTGNVGTDFLWLMEKTQITKGGPIALNGEGVTLRDLNSSLYLKMDTESCIGVVERHEASIFEFYSSQTQVSDLSENLSDQNSVNVLAGGIWISHNGNENAIGADVEGCNSKSRALSLVVSSDLFKRIGMHVYVGVYATTTLKKFVQISRDFENNKVHIRELAVYLRYSAQVLEKLIVFFAQKSSNEKEGLIEVAGLLSKEVLTIRQNMVREQGLLEALLDILVFTESGVYNRVKTYGTFRDQSITLRRSVRNFTTQSPSIGTPKLNETDLDEPIVKPRTSQVTGRRSSFQLLPGFGTKEREAPKRKSIVEVLALQSKPAATNLPRSPSLDMRKSKRLSVSKQANFSGFPSKDEFMDKTEDSEKEYDYSFNNKTTETNSTSYQIAQKCLKVLFCTIAGNFSNQLYVADRFPILLHQVKEHPIAVRCVEEMLRENLMILQTKVREREIDIFVNLLSEFEMSPAFLKLIQSTCSCPMGVDATQRMVVNALFNENIPPPPPPILLSSDSCDSPDSSEKIVRSNRKLVMQIHSEKTKLEFVDWGDLSLYCKKENFSHINGFQSLQNGLPELFVSWELTGTNGLFGMPQLFGYKDRIPLAVICNSARQSNIHRISKRGISSLVSSNSPVNRRKANIYQQKGPRNGVEEVSTIVSISKHKAQVADYLNTQLYLVADLCLDRNYVSIGLLESLYPYETLVSMLKSSIVTKHFKAAVCRILRCLYVDREPQVSSQFPRYIRTSTSLGGAPNRPRTGSEDNYDTEQHLAELRKQEAYLCKFAFIQKIISDYVNNSLDLKHSDDLSAELLKLLEALVSFGFYTSVPQILDVLKPLIKSLDQHRLPDVEDQILNAKVKDKISNQSNSSKSPLLTNLSMKLSSKQIIPVGNGDESVYQSQKFESQSVKNGYSALNPLIGDQASTEIYVSEDSWMYKFYLLTESIEWMVFVLIVVLVSVIMAFIQLFTTLYVPVYLYVTIAFFTLEFSGRLFAFYQVRGNLLTFFQDPFNILDCCLLLLDYFLLIFGEGSSEANASRATRSIRVVRFLRVIRLIRAARIIQSISESAVEVVKWVEPKRFQEMKPQEAETVVSSLNILSMFYDRIQDKRLDIAIKAFSIWCDNNKIKVKSEPNELFMKLLNSEESISTELSATYDSVLLDLMMYSDVEVAQKALQLLMIHKSQSSIFFNITDKIQIVYSPRVEIICTQLTSMLKELKRLAEMFEIWSEMKTDVDKASANRVLDILYAIKNFIAKRNEDRSLGIRSIYLVDEEVQNLLRNLDAMNPFMALLESLYDGGREELTPPIIAIMQRCNELISLFVKNSEANQQNAFKYISWFVERVDDGINSIKVARTIVEGNKTLIKQCPRLYLIEFAQKIVRNGRKPEYLDLFLGMTEFSDLNGSRVIAVETEISSFLTAREWKKHILLWCCNRETDEYNERKRLMEELIHAHNDNDTEKTSDDIIAIPEESLPNDLKYHIKLLHLLANCNLGPKLHAIYPVNDVLAAILDPSTIFHVRKALGNLLVAFLRTSSDRVEKSDLFWIFLDEIMDTLEELPNELVVLSRDPLLRIQRGEWIEMCTRILVNFFQNFDLLAFNEYKNDRNSSMNKLSNIEPKGVMNRLYAILKTLIDIHSPKIGTALSEEVGLVLNSLHFILDTDLLECENPSGGGGGGTDVNDTKLKMIRMNHQRSSVIYADVQQLFYRKQFKLFIKQIKDANQHSNDSEEAVKFFKNISRLDQNNIESDVRLEPLLKKMTLHFRSMIKRNPLSRSIDDSVVETCEWLLQTFRHMFEKELGISCDNFYDITMSNLLPESVELQHLRKIYNENGVIYLCMDLISIGIDHRLCIEAMKMLIALLLKSGGCMEIQHNIYLYLRETDSLLFFELVKDMIENLKTWSNRENEVHNINYQDRIKTTNIPEDIIVLLLIQGLCEGQYMNNRQIIRDQTDNNKVVNVMEGLASYVGILSRSDNVANTYLAILVLRTVLRLVQGPCKGNQEHFVLQTELLISLNRIIRASRPSIKSMLTSDYQVYLEELKICIIDLLRGLVEGQNDSSLVFDRVSTTIDFSVLHLLVIPDQTEYYREKLLDHKTSMSDAEAKFMILSQSMQLESTVSTNSTVIEHYKEEITFVEVVWDRQVHVAYFRIPQFAKDISMESKSKVLDKDEEFASRETKLIDFIGGCKSLFRESRHQQFLKHYGLSHLWAMKYYLTRLMFVNALIINILILVFFTTRNNHTSSADDDHTTPTDDAHRFLSYQPPTLTDHIFRFLSGSSTVTYHANHIFVSHEANLAINVLNILQIIGSVITVLIFAIVRIPVSFSTEYERSKSVLSGIKNSLMDPLPIWYCGYLVATILSVRVSHLFSSILLLDWIVLDSTTQDLLYAVQYPARQLGATLVIILIMLNIFAAIVFVFYRQDVVTVLVVNMWDALKLCISYGFRGEYGVDHEMEPTLGVRMILDVVFYFTILSILRHIFFAIIVDTFGKLREIKFEREAEARNTCYICGIERHDFDRIIPAGSSSNFTTHRTIIHNPMNYMYFVLNLWNQDQSEDSSLEIHVRRCLQNNDIGWFPTGISLDLKESFNQHSPSKVNKVDQLHGDVTPRPGGHGCHGGGHGGHDNGGDNGGHGGHGGHGAHAPSVKASIAPTDDTSFKSSPQNNSSYQELHDKMGSIQKQIQKLVKHMNNFTNTNASIMTTSIDGTVSGIHTSSPLLRQSLSPIKSSINLTEGELQPLLKSIPFPHIPENAPAPAVPAPATAPAVVIDHRATDQLLEKFSKLSQSLEFKLETLFSRVEEIDHTMKTNNRAIRSKLRAVSELSNPTKRDKKPDESDRSTKSGKFKPLVDSPSKSPTLEVDPSSPPQITQEELVNSLGSPLLSPQSEHITKIRAISARYRQLPSDSEGGDSDVIMEQSEEVQEHSGRVVKQHQRPRSAISSSFLKSMNKVSRGKSTTSLEISAEMTPSELTSSLGNQEISPLNEHHFTGPPKTLIETAWGETAGHEDTK